VKHTPTKVFVMDRAFVADAIKIRANQLSIEEKATIIINSSSNNNNNKSLNMLASKVNENCQKPLEN